MYIDNLSDSIDTWTIDAQNWLSLHGIGPHKHFLQFSSFEFTENLHIKFL